MDVDLGDSIKPGPSVSIDWNHCINTGRNRILVNLLCVLLSTWAHVHIRRYPLRRGVGARLVMAATRLG